MKPEKILAPVAAALMFALAACSSLVGPPPAPQLYVLAPQLGALTDAPQVSWQLVVAEPDAPESLNSPRIALMRGVTLDYFANAAWADRVPALIQGALVDAFDKSGKIAAAGRDTEGVRGDYRLETALRDFSAHYDSESGNPVITVRIVAKLVKGREIVASLDSVHTEQASANSVPAVVEAFDTALSASLEEIAGWALKSAPPA
jgi:cholesterol transport system auxiliary component